jgi:cytochrome c5
MSEHQTEENSHSSFIKTPKELLAVVFLAFAVPILLISIVAGLVSRSVDPGAGGSAEAVASRLKPVGLVVVAEGSDVPGQRTGKQIVEAVCAACHATGALNAPKIGDKTAWDPLMKEGHSDLTATAIKGIRQMPPRGGNPELTDVEIARAVAYMANQSGANFREPEIQPAAPMKVAAAGSVSTTDASAAAAPAASATKGGDAAKGKSVFDTTCSVCHGPGIAGAPKAGDKAAWAPRLKQGAAALHEVALKGKGAMPPKGGNNALSESDVTAAVDYMLSLVK